jgi:DNA-binding transcriptional ArsR family regulator
MSPLNTDSGFDPDCFRLSSTGATLIPVQARRRSASPIRDKFIKGPIPVPWVCEASKLGVKILLVGLALWHIRGLRKTDSFIVSNILLRGWGISPDAKNRALRKLEKAGLVAIERRGKRSPQVTLLPCSS